MRPQLLEPQIGIKVCNVDEVPVGTTKLHRQEGKQVVIFATSEGFFACNNQVSAPRLSAK